MTRIVICIIIIIFFYSCQTAERKTGTPIKDTTGSFEAAHVREIMECYRWVQKRDTVTAMLVQKGNEITGHLVFDNYGIDGSSGYVHGVVVADTLKLWYEFHSEGMKSVMEIWFTREGNRLMRGTGPVDVKGDTSYFTDPSAVVFPDQQVLRKVLCDSVNDM